MSTCAFVSFRLGLTDGVSIVADRWIDAFRSFGFDVVTVAGEGAVDRCVPGLAIDAVDPPSPSELGAVLEDADLVVVENLLTIPMNLPAARVVAEFLRGRAALLHHHDPPWQRERYSHVTALPIDDPAWRHVVINRVTAAEMRARRIDATVIYNGFETRGTGGDRAGTRANLGVDDDELLVVHPVRAIERKGVPEAIRLAEKLGATYWLTGRAEEDYGPRLERELGHAGCRVIHRSLADVDDVYAAADLVAFPSSWEGFGNPPIEASIRRRPVVIGPYPVAAELLELGFRWFDLTRISAITRFLRAPDHGLLDHNERVATRHFSLEVMADRLRSLLDDAGWNP